MKTYEQCLQEWRESIELEKRLRDEQKRNSEDTRVKLIKSKRFTKGETTLEEKALMDEYRRKSNELKEQLFIWRTEHKIKLHNVKYAMWTECVPIIIEVYGKYAGKQYGPKTKEKIGQEIFEKTGERFKCCVIGGSQYTDGFITIYAVDYPYNVTIDIPAYPTLFAGNTIEELTEDDLKLEGVRWEYIEDTRKATLELIEQYRKVQATMQVLCSEASKYKAMSVSGMGELPYYKPLDDYDM